MTKNQMLALKKGDKIRVLTVGRVISGRIDTFQVLYRSRWSGAIWAIGSNCYLPHEIERVE